jgi:large conductance mechanosensitive channel
VLRGFRDFIMRGNVVDLAVAFVIGVAFAAVVTAFTSNIINPLVAAVGGTSVHGLGFQLVASNPKTVLDFGAVISAIINFIIVAAIIYFVLVVPMNKLAERRRRGQEPDPVAPAEDILLLQQIRDLLQDRTNLR